MPMRRLRSTAAAAAIGAAVIGGGAAGVAITSAVAQTPSSTTTAPAQEPAANQAPQAPRTPPWQDAIDGLVKDGTLTQAQADKVVAALKDAMPHRGDRGPGGPRGARPDLDVIASTLGMTTDEVRTELQSGKSLADIAAAKNVDKQKLVDALVADATKHLDQAVADGHLTQEQADQRKADLTQHITDLVDGKLPRPPAGGPMGPDGPDGPGWHHGPDDQQGTTTTTR